MAGMKTARASLILVLVVVAFAAVKPSRASTAEEMLSACRPIAAAKVSNRSIALPQDFDSGVCWGAFETLDWMLTTMNVRTGSTFFPVCIPQNRTRPQLIAIFVKYAENHPARYAEEFTGVAYAAEREAFPCPDSKP
jgi:hypothetical protein